MATERKYALEFRSEDTSYVMERWRASQSCSLVGIGSVGKSNLLRHLSDPEVQAYYMSRQNSDRFKAIIIDPNMLGSLPMRAADDDSLHAWAGYELLMHRLYLAYYPLDILENDARTFYEVYQALQDGSNPLFAYMAVRYFELGLQFFMRRSVRLVFMFDEFEEMMRQMPVKFFQNLRGLRDSYKNQLAYLTFTRAPLKVAANQLGLPAAEFEAFQELFTDSTYYVGPYNQADALMMLQELTRHTGKQIPEALATLLIRVSGGYAGLLRSAFTLVDPAAPIAEDDSITQFLLSKVPIRTECRTLWTSLTQPEQFLLKAVARLAPYDINPETEQAIAQLVQKRVIRLDKPSQKLEIHPPLFRVYIASVRDEV